MCCTQHYKRHTKWRVKCLLESLEPHWIHANYCTLWLTHLWWVRYFILDGPCLDVMNWLLKTLPWNSNSTDWSSSIWWRMAKAKKHLNTQDISQDSEKTWKVTEKNILPCLLVPCWLWSLTESVEVFCKHLECQCFRSLLQCVEEVSHWHKYCRWIKADETKLWYQHRSMRQHSEEEPTPHNKPEPNMYLNISNENQHFDL